MMSWDDGIHVRWQHDPFRALQQAITILAVIWAVTATALLIWTTERTPAVRVVDETGEYVGPLYAWARSDTLTISIRSVP